MPQSGSIFASSKQSIFAHKVRAKADFKIYKISSAIFNFHLSIFNYSFREQII